MIARACPRCRSVANLAHVALPMTGRDKGEWKCLWCGWLGHESELAQMPLPGPEPEPRGKREKAKDDDPFLFEV